MTGTSRRRLWWRTPAAASTLVRARTWTTTRPRRRSSGWIVPPPRRPRDRSAPFWRAKRSARAWWTICWNFARFCANARPIFAGKRRRRSCPPRRRRFARMSPPTRCRRWRTRARRPCASFGETPRVARSSSARARASRQTRGAVGGEGCVGGETVGRARGRGRATRGDAVATVAGGGAGGDDETRVEGRTSNRRWRLSCPNSTRDARRTSSGRLTPRWRESA